MASGKMTGTVHTAMTMPPKKLLSCSPSTFSCKSEARVSSSRGGGGNATDLEQQRNEKEEEQVHLRSLANEIEPFLGVRRYDQRSHQRGERNEDANHHLPSASWSNER